MILLLLSLCLSSVIDDCTNTSCDENSVCVDGPNSFSCKCMDGITPWGFCDTGRQLLLKFDLFF